MRAPHVVAAPSIDMNATSIFEYLIVAEPRLVIDPGTQMLLEAPPSEALR
jgi:hypothetical protein